MEVLQEKALDILKKMKGTRISYRKSEAKTQQLYKCVGTKLSTLEWSESSTGVRHGRILSSVFFNKVRGNKRLDV
jgi:hypothetical protein